MERGVKEKEKDHDVKADREDKGGRTYMLDRISDPQPI